MGGSFSKTKDMKKGKPIDYLLQDVPDEWMFHLSHKEKMEKTKKVVDFFKNNVYGENDIKYYFIISTMMDIIVHYKGMLDNFPKREDESLVDRIKEEFPENVQGDTSFIDDLLPKNIKVHHIDTFPGRFQGIFYFQPKEEDTPLMMVAPLQVLRACRNYQIMDSVKYTIWIGDLPLNRGRVINLNGEIAQEQVDSLYDNPDCFNDLLI